MAEKKCKKCHQVNHEDVPTYAGVLYENHLWMVCHKGDPVGVSGHLQLVSKRHFQGPAHMNDEEAATVGPMLRHCEALLQQVSGAKQVYTAALGASFPHFHCHMVPVFPEEVQEVAGCAWDVFLQEKLVSDGRKMTDRSRSVDVALAFKDAIRASPPPPEAGHRGLRSKRQHFGRALVSFTGAYVVTRIMDALLDVGTGKQDK
mmetsp:Transcript_10536/g.20017  ORF Transcript_10536/g.20017 Transcript_10536/m.20017 type:complete len:203 (+) Transcript_10536:110-718(+)|eukprot:CAMPEP_0114252350 /NCGR_PEP_ID=MMETSP0058-20121206/15785_1 /TAXON_ID=36894 /ORGANISM="Pyramimonas parkeae, CCMP726" /LENGTH=202 /DNA_ID=CAMNT_0001366269 /DNA_START=84 /DNA_END=692 /DNA_ORIENTATION=-